MKRRNKASIAVGLILFVVLIFITSVFAEERERIIFRPEKFLRELGKKWEEELKSPQGQMEFFQHQASFDYPEQKTEDRENYQNSIPGFIKRPLKELIEKESREVILKDIIEPASPALKKFIEEAEEKIKTYTAVKFSMAGPAGKDSQELDLKWNKPDVEITKIKGKEKDKLTFTLGISLHIREILKPYLKFENQKFSGRVEYEPLDQKWEFECSVKAEKLNNFIGRMVGIETRFGLRGEVAPEKQAGFLFLSFPWGISSKK